MKYLIMQNGERFSFSPVHEGETYKVHDAPASVTIHRGSSCHNILYGSLIEVTEDVRHARKMMYRYQYILQVHDS